MPGLNFSQGVAFQNILAAVAGAGNPVPEAGLRAPRFPMGLLPGNCWRLSLHSLFFHAFNAYYLTVETIFLSPGYRQRVLRRERENRRILDFPDEPKALQESLTAGQPWRGTLVPKPDGAGRNCLR